MSEHFALFLLTSWVNILTPGLGVVMIVTLAAENGWRRTVGAALGLALGIGILFVLAVSGLGVIMAASPKLFAAVKTAGAGVLVYLGVKKLLASAPRAHAPGLGGEESGRTLFVKAIVISLTNPQPMIFAVSLLPQFIDPAIPYVPQVTLLVSVYVLMVFATMIAYAVAAGHARRFLMKGNGPILMTRITGFVFIGLALWVLWGTFF